MEAVTGLTYTPDDILQVGERINNLARAFNTREGLSIVLNIRHRP